MELRPMQYKGFVWPHNPRTYTITYDRQVAVHKVPFGRYAMQDLGMTHRVMRGEGEFVGRRPTTPSGLWPRCSTKEGRGPCSTRCGRVPRSISWPWP